MGGWWVVYLDYNVSSGPFLSYEIEIGDGPGPELDNLLKHIQNVHLQEYKYKCKLCKKPFKDQSSRDRHQSNIKLHERQKIDPKICTLCGKSFKSKFSRERHESVCKMK